VTALGAAAQSYAARGWRVFPLHSITLDGLDIFCTCGRKDCSSAAKHPRLQHGVLEASSDPLTVGEWWTRWPDANVGLATGVGSGIYVIDLDGPDAVEAWADLGLPNGWRSVTGNGLHLVYSIAEPLPSTHWKLGRGIDSRGDGGYIVAPPSRHRSGKTYAWEEGLRWSGHPPALPEALIGALTPTLATPPAAATIRYGATTTYGKGVLKHACERVRAAAEGTRNSTLNDEAFLVGQFVAGGEIDPQGVAAALAESSTDTDRKKVATTVQRALRDGANYPRNKP
jgi:hypothetical protein